MLTGADLSQQFWAEAVSTATYMNRIPGRASGIKTPEELWSNKIPNLSSMRVFGCQAMVHVPDANRRKLDNKSIECIFLGYSDESKAYRMYNTTTHKIVVSRDVIFMETPKIEVKDFTNQKKDYFICLLPVEAENATANEQSVASNVAKNDNTSEDESETPHDHEADEEQVANVTSDLDQTFEDAQNSLPSLNETVVRRVILQCRLAQLN